MGLSSLSCPRPQLHSRETGTWPSALSLQAAEPGQGCPLGHPPHTCQGIKLSSWWCGPRGEELVYTFPTFWTWTPLLASLQRTQLGRVRLLLPEPAPSIQSALPPIPCSAKAATTRPPTLSLSILGATPPLRKPL